MRLGKYKKVEQGKFMFSVDGVVRIRIASNEDKALEILKREYPTAKKIVRYVPKIKPPA